MAKTRSFLKQYSRLITVVLVGVGILAIYLIVKAVSANSEVALSLSPDAQTITKGETINLEIQLNTGGQNVNAVQAVIIYPTSQLKYVKTSTADSAFKVDVPVSVQNGSITVPRASIKPVNSNDAVVATIQFRALQSGQTAQVNIGSDSQVYSSDTNKNILQKVRGGKYSIE